MTALLALLPGWGKWAALIVGGVLLVCVPFFYGKSIGRTQALADAAKIAINRISEMEKNDASFRSKPAHDRCVIFMRDSGLPIDQCD
jgi:hypothetical protein